MSADISGIVTSGLNTITTVAVGGAVIKSTKMLTGSKKSKKIF